MAFSLQISRFSNFCKPFLILEPGYFSMCSDCSGRSGSRFPTGARAFIPSTMATPALGHIQLLFYGTVPRFFPEGLSVGTVFDHSAPSSVDVKNEWIYNSSSPIYLPGVSKDKPAIFLNSNLCATLKNCCDFPKIRKALLKEILSLYTVQCIHGNELCRQSVIR